MGVKAPFRGLTKLPSSPLYYAYFTTGTLKLVEIQFLSTIYNTVPSVI